jgi:hypothetical protein
MPKARGAVLLAGIVMLGGCGRDGTSNVSRAAGANKTDSDAACKLVDEPDASALFGVPAKSAPDAIGQGGAASECIWEADDNADHSYLLQVRIYDDVNHYGGETAGLFPNKQPVSGLGDKAFVNSGDTIAGTDVQFVKDGKTYTVNYGITNVMADVRKNASDQADELVELVKSNAAKVEPAR